MQYFDKFATVPQNLKKSADDVFKRREAIPATYRVNCEISIKTLMMTVIYLIITTPNF